MPKTIKKFGYTIIKKRKSDPLPFNPIVQICLEQWTTSDDGRILLTPDLMTEGEIDWYVQALKSDLDSVGKKAKAALKGAKGNSN